MNNLLNKYNNISDSNAKEEFVENLTINQLIELYENAKKIEVFKEKEFLKEKLYKNCKNKITSHEKDYYYVKNLVQKIMQQDDFLNKYHITELYNLYIYITANKDFVSSDKLEIANTYIYNRIEKLIEQNNTITK